MKKEKIYMWVASSNDGSFQDKSDKSFDTKEEAYNDMRNHALDKMKWNTEYAEDFADDDEIGYKVSFSPNKIIHESYSGIYTYQIQEYKEEETARFKVEFDLSAPDATALSALEDTIKEALSHAVVLIMENINKNHVKRGQVSDGIEHIR